MKKLLFALSIIIMFASCEQQNPICENDNILKKDSMIKAPLKWFEK